MKKLLFSLIMFSLVHSTNGQIELKKKEIRQNLERISSSIVNEDYEEAINIFFSKKEIIKEEKVRKKDRQQYYTLRNELEHKLQVFNENDSIVKLCNVKFINNNYCDALNVFSLELDKSNSFNQTRQNWIKLKNQLYGYEGLCKAHSEMVARLGNISPNNYEEIFILFELSAKNGYSFYNNDLLILDSLKRIYSDEYENYKRIRNISLISPKKTLTKIEQTKLNSLNAQKLINQLFFIKNGSIQAFSSLVYAKPVLKKEYLILQKDIDSKINVINKYIKNERIKEEHMQFYSEMNYYKNKTNLFSKLNEYRNGNKGSIEIIKNAGKPFNYSDFRIISLFESYSSDDYLIIEDNYGSICKLNKFEFNIDYGANDSLLVVRAFKNKLPVLISSVELDVNSAGGVELEIDFENSSKKVIKYIDFYVTFFNAVNDVVFDDISSEGYYINLELTGPIKSFEERFWGGLVIYNYNANKVHFDWIAIEYMDGTSQKIENKVMLNKCILPHLFFDNVKQ